MTAKKPPRGGALSGRGGRSLNQRVKKGRGLKNSSRRWIERQINDPYVQRAKAEGMRSRAAYKLIEIDDKHHILKKGDRVIDLGAAPGGWCQVAVQRIGSTDADKRIAAIDYLEMDPMPGVEILQMDFLDDEAPQKLIEALGGMPDVVVSDMAAPTIGHRQTDHLRTIYLCETAADFAASVLKPGGHFVAKVFRGGTEGDLLARLKRDFSSLNHVKPPASRAESVELYLVARGFRGT